MAKTKATITLDRHKAEQARLLLGAASTSAAIDAALERLISAERTRRDVEAYRLLPPTAAEMTLADLPDATGLDDTDWESIYADLEP